MTAMKQANEFGFPQQGIAIVPMSFQNVDIVAAGLEVTKGQLIATSFFEDVTPAARKWSDQFYARRKAMPSQIEAGVHPPSGITCKQSRIAAQTMARRSWSG